MWKFCLILAVLSAYVSAATDKLVCYYGSWAVYRQGNCKYAVENIDPNLCTHIIYGFIGINSDASIRIMDPWNDVDLAAFKRFTGLKSKNSELKALVAIGGWNEGSTGFTTIVSNPTLRKKFAENAIKFLQTYGFDGLDLDWEYPAQRGGASTDKANFSKWLAELRAAFDPYGFLLTAAVAACEPSIDYSYDVPELNKYLHFINVMTYDIHGAWESVTGQNAPLYASPIEAQQNLNVDACIRGWINRGANPEKLHLGVGTYGRSFQLANSNNHNLGAPAVGGGTAGRCTSESGIIGYFEICEKLKNGGWTVVWDDHQKVPYAYSGNQWIGYDNVQSVTLKTEYAKSKGLGGVMVWSLETDDFNGLCGIVNPILKTIRNTLQLPVVEPPPSPPSSGSTTTTVPPPPSSDGTCTSEGFIRDLSNCSVFYQCIKEGDTFVAHQFQCPAGLYFDDVAIACNYPSEVDC